MHSARIISLRIQKVVLALGILSYWDSAVLFSWGFVNLSDDFTQAVCKHNAQTRNDEFNKVLFITKPQLVVVLCGSSHWFPQFLCVVPVTGSQFLCVYSSTHWFPQYLCVVPMIGSQFLFVYTWFQSLVPIVSLCGSNDGFAVFVCMWFWSLVCIAFLCGWRDSFPEGQPSWGLHTLQNVYLKIPKLKHHFPSQVTTHSLTQTQFEHFYNRYQSELCTGVVSSWTVLIS